MIRLFIAIPLPQQIKFALHGMGRSIQGGRPVSLEQIHLTMRFVGEVESSLLKDIEECLDLVETEPFAIQIRGVGHFPPRGKPRVLWAGVEPCDELALLKRRIDGALAKCGVPPDNRKFSPHVTLARLNTTSIGRVTEFLAGNSFLEFDEFTLNSFHLYSSTLSPKGAVHALEAAYSL